MTVETVVLGCRAAGRRARCRVAAAVLVLVSVLLTPVAVAAPAVPWDSRGDAVLTPAQALEALAALPEDAPAAVSWAEGGSRTGWFGQTWEDVDGDGCDTRNEILSRDLEQADYSRAEGLQPLEEGVGQGARVCPDATVWSGTLHDPYTGSVLSFTRGADTSAQVQIDHVVPLSYLYAHGAWAWDARTRLLAANDPLNLLAVDGEANQDKGACGPATCPIGSTQTGTWDPAGGSGWWPPDDAFRCSYAARFVSVLAAYELGVPEADAASLRSVLEDCAAGGDGAPGPLGSANRALDAVGDGLLARSDLVAVLVLGSALLGTGLVLRSRRGRGRRGQRGLRGRLPGRLGRRGRPRPTPHGHR